MIWYNDIGGDKMELQGRIKEVRKSLGMTQEKFAESLGIPKRTFIAYENAQNPIPERLIISLCAVHGVDEAWLRTGKGEMFPPKTADEEYAELLGGLLADEPESFRRRLVTAICKLDESQIAAVKDFMKSLIDERTEKK